MTRDGRFADTLAMHTNSLPHCNAFSTIGSIVNFRRLGIPAMVVSVERDGNWIVVGMRRKTETSWAYVQYDYFPV